MDEKAIFKLCKEEGCCNACCLRYLGLKHPRTYENVKESAKKYYDEPAEEPEANGAASSEPAEQSNGTNGVADDSGDQACEGPAAKRRRGAPCTSCLGLLEEATWPDACRMAKEELDKKRYSVSEFACALSAPLATLVRDQYMLLTIAERFPDYKPGSVTSLKEAWKWTLGAALGRHAGLALASGAAAALLLTLHYEYPGEPEELEMLKALSPAMRAQPGRAADVTRRGVLQALAGASRAQLAGARGAGRARVVAVATARAPLYIAGRYIKLSRSLPQTPWLVRGKRMMESSVQEIIFKPIADLYELSPEQSEHRLKFVAAGREDVDVRCLGTGRPFALEISDPRRELSAEELARACAAIADSGSVRVERMTHVTREDLAELKKGEETKSKDYEALCIKLAHSDLDQVSDPSEPVRVTAADILRVNAFRNTPPEDAAPVQLLQRTPIRVLHRRPLLARRKHVLHMRAEPVPGHAALLLLRLRTCAGTYVKEFVHGELGRTRPALRGALRAPADLLALDVTHVALPWPPAAALP